MGKLKKRLIIFGTSGLVIAIATTVVILRLSAPVEGTLLNAAVVQDTKSKQLIFDFTPKTIIGSYVSFTVPVSLKVAPNSKLVGPVIEMHNLTYRDVETWNLAIQILSVPSGRITDNSSYTFAKAHPDLYQESHMTIGDQSILTMTDKTVGGFKKIAFLMHGTHQAVISLYGDDASGNDKLQSTLNMIISSWQWLAS